jgi:hypothetical protein
MFMWVNSKGAHQLRPPPAHTEGSRKSVSLFYGLSDRLSATVRAVHADA